MKSDDVTQYKIATFQKHILNPKILPPIAPPGLGDNFQPAKLEPIMKQTSRILRIDVVDGGKGYSNIPKVEVLQNGVKIACDSCAILDRNGSVDSIVVLKPGFGYSGNDKSPIDVRIAARGARHKEPEWLRVAAQMISQELCDHVTMPAEFPYPALLSLTLAWGIACLLFLVLLKDAFGVARRSA